MAPQPPTAAVEFDCELRQIKTMADGTVNVTLNLPEYCMPHVKAMMDWLGGSLKVVAAFQSDNEEETAENTWEGGVKDWK